MSVLKHLNPHIKGDGIDPFVIQVTRDTEVGNVSEDMTGQKIIFQLSLNGVIIQDFSTDSGKGITYTDIQNGLAQFDGLDSWNLPLANYQYKFITIINGFTETLRHGYFPFVEVGTGKPQDSVILTLDLNSVSNVINQDSLIVVGSYPKFKIVINDIDAPFTEPFMLLGMHQFDGGDQTLLSNYTKNIGTEI